MHVSSPAPSHSRRRVLDSAVAALCVVVAVVVTSHELNVFGVGFGEQLVLSAAVVGTVVLPGLLISWPFPTGSLLPRLGMAFAAGIGAQLLGWAVGVSVGQTWILWVLPLAFALIWRVIDVAVLRLVKRRRGAHEEAGELDDPARETVSRRHDAMPWWGSLAVLASWLCLLRSMSFGLWAITPLNYSRPWYQDLYWHVSITADAMHHVPPTDPQSASEGALSYHWFSNAHAAALALTSGVPVAKIAVIAWAVPIMLAVLGLVYGFTRYLSRTHSAAALAVLLVAFPPNTIVLHSIDTGATSGLVWLSPSHIFSLPIAVAAAWVAVRVFREHRPSVGTYCFLFYLAVVCPGTKVSLLPTLLGGVAVVGVMALIRRRGYLRPLAVGAVGVLITLASAPLFAGGGGGSVPRFGATADQLRIWHRTVHNIGTPSTITLLLVIVALLGTYVGYLSIGTLFADKRDPAPRFFAGMMLVALLAMFGLEHPSLSQVYFMRGIAAVSTCVLAWAVVATARRGVRHFGERRTSVTMVLTFTAALGLGWLWQETIAFNQPENLSSSWLVPLCLCILLTVVGLTVAQRKSGPVAAATTLIVTTGILGYSVTFSALGAAQDPQPLAHAPRAPHPVVQSAYLTPDEQSGAAALARANRDGALIATNVHCLHTVTTPTCDARGFWVSALSESPTFIGGWAYSSSARSRDGVAGRSYIRQPYYRAGDFTLNERVFAEPTAGDLAALRARGVRFLFADDRASRVSPDLTQLADVVWKSDTVTVVRLRP